MRERGGRGNGRRGCGERQVLECDPSGVVLGFFGGFEESGSLEREMIDKDSGGERGVVIEALLSDGVLWQAPRSLLAQLLEIRFVHFPDMPAASSFFCSRVRAQGRLSLMRRALAQRRRIYQIFHNLKTKVCLAPHFTRSILFYFILFF